MKEKSSKARDDLAKREEENIVLSAVVKQKEMAIEQLEQVEKMFAFLTVYVTEIKV